MSVFNDGDRQEINYEFRRQEYLDRKAEQECCGNCRWHEKDEQYGDDWICGNDDSEQFGDYTSWSDGCSEYERR